MFFHPQLSPVELLLGIGEFLRGHCRRLCDFDDVVLWTQSIHRWLLQAGCEDTPLTDAAYVVFLYMLLCDSVDRDVESAVEVKAIVMACIYVTCS